MKTGKIKSFFPRKNSKMKKSPTFSYDLPYENHEKSPVMKLTILKHNVHEVKHENVVHTVIVFCLVF